jgi:hypothetical protein
VALKRFSAGFNARDVRYAVRLLRKTPHHVATIVGTAVVLAVVSVAACLLPSHRAAHISPMEALSE